MVESVEINTNNAWTRSPKQHRHTIDHINISDYRISTNIIPRQKPNIFQQDENNNEENAQKRNSEENTKIKEENSSKNESWRIESGNGVATLQHCIARLADLSKGYGSISLVCLFIIYFGVVYKYFFIT
jgi:hypothetical protein